MQPPAHKETDAGCGEHKLDDITLQITFEHDECDEYALNGMLLAAHRDRRRSGDGHDDDSDVDDLYEIVKQSHKQLRHTQTTMKAVEVNGATDGNVQNVVSGRIRGGQYI